MEGILHPSHASMEYCAKLIREYSILDCAQVYLLLKKCGGLSKKARFGEVKKLCRLRHAMPVSHGGRNYLAGGPRLRPEGRYLAQILCFWILLDYIDKVDSHYAKGTYSRVSLEFEGRDYDILYVERGYERLCMNNMEQGGKTRFFVVVENVEQIPLIKGEKIHTFATVNERGGIQYYASPH